MSETPNSSSANSSNSDSSSTNSGGSAALPPRLPQRRGGGNKKALIAGGVAVLLVIGAGSAWALSRGDDTKQVSIGTTEASQPYWAEFVKVAKDRGIDVKLVNFSDYTQADPALQQGQLDTNSFQHLQFLADFNVKNKTDLKAVGSTYIVPLSLYSKKYTSLSQLPANAQVAIPNDPTNQARALLVLQKAGLITLKNGGNSQSTPADVQTSKIKITPVDAAQTVTSLPSVGAAIVNNNFALDAKLDPSKALYKDNPTGSESDPYINVFAVRAADVDNSTYKELVSIYHDPKVLAALKAQTKNTAIVVNKTPAELNSILTKLEGQEK